MTQKTPNSQPIPVNVVGASTFGRYPKISLEKTYNMFISDNWLVNFAGWKRVFEIFPEGEGRGMFRSVRGNFLLVVVNSSVYSFDSNFVATFVGTLATSAEEVFIDENLNSQVCIVDGLNAYIYFYGSGGPSFTTQTLSGSLIPNYVTYHNTFFLFGNADTTSNGAKWYAYSFASNTTISQTTELALQTKPDFAIAVQRIPGQSANVLVFGTTVCEIHTQIGGTQNYRRVNTISVDYGCLSVATIASADEFIAWLGVNESNAPVILVYQGQGAYAISSDGIDYLLTTIQFPEDSTSSFVKIDGHLIYQLTFFNPVDNLTLMYDFNTKKFFHLSDENLNYHPARDYAYFGNETYFVSLNNGSIYRTSTDITVIDENITTTDPNQIFTIQRIRICDNIAQDDSDKFIANFFRMTIEQGNDPGNPGASLDIIIPLITEDAFAPPDAFLITEFDQVIVDEASWNNQPTYTIPYQPRVDLSLSYDGGITFSNTVGRNLNQTGFRKNILSWNRLGMANVLTLKFRFWGMDRFVVNNGVLEIK